MIYINYLKSVKFNSVASIKVYFLVRILMFVLDKMLNSTCFR